jgi:hypothetical protein
MGGFQELIPQSTYLTTGPAFGRIAQWLRHFDPDFYRTHLHLGDHSDLDHLDRESLYQHFIETGWTEGRSYSRFLYSFIQPEFYRQRYPELGLATPQEALRHWMYEGYYEGRIPNEVTQFILDSDVHLFQFGKVGSKAIQEALYSAGYNRHVVHLHWPSDMMTTYPDCIFSYEEVVRRELERPIKFIVGVRDPIARAIAGYFETASTGDEAALLNTPVEMLGEIITEDFFHAGRIDFILNWIEHSFFRDVDVYGFAFNPAEGYVVIESDSTQIFLYRLEDLPRLEEPLSQFAGLNLRLQRVNAAADKPYAALYRAAIEDIRFDSSDVERAMSSQMTRHFYSEREIEHMRKRWVATRRRRWKTKPGSATSSA